MPEGLQNILSRIFQWKDCLQVGSGNLTAKGMVDNLAKLDGIPVRPACQEGIAASRLSCIHCNLGFALRFRSRQMEAHAQFDRATRIDPTCAFQVRLRIQNATQVEVDAVMDNVLQAMQALVIRVGFTSEIYLQSVLRLTSKVVDISIFRTALWDQLTGLKLFTDIGFLQGLRDELLLSDTFERELMQAVRATMLELPLEKAARVSNCSIIVDKTHFAQTFERSLLMLESLTPHQAEKLKELMGLIKRMVSDSSEEKHLQLAGPAGPGKTFIALHQMLQTLREHATAYVVFVAQNTALAHFVAHWMYVRTKDCDAEICSRLHILCGPRLDSHCNFRVGQSKISIFARDKDIKYNLLVADESHHLYSQDSLVKKMAGFAKRFVNALTIWLLLSGVSQSTVFEETVGAL
jgi:hypothetical protein